MHTFAGAQVELRAGDRVLKRWKADLSPEQPLLETVAVNAPDAKALRLVVRDNAGQTIIEHTIDTELAEELSFLAKYDETKRAIQEIVDMPDRQIDLFIRFCLQNNGRLSARKRNDRFDFLTNDEIDLMELALQAAYGGQPSDGP